MCNKRSSFALAILIVMSAIITLIFANVTYAQVTDNNPFITLDNAHDQSLRIAKGTVGHRVSLQRSLSLDEKKQKEKDLLAASGKRYIVKFKEEVSMQQIFDIVDLYKYKLIGKSERRMFLLKTSDIQDFEQKATGLIEFIEEDKVRKSHVIPSDTYYSYQWALPALNMSKAWDITKGSNTVYVAIIDSGVNRNHPDLAGADIRNGWDYILDEFCDWDSVGHGTNVTGIIGAQTNNDKGIAGVNWNVAIIPQRAIWSDGFVYESGEIQAIYDAADMECDVINLSIGGPDYSPAENLAISYAIAKGSIVVASAGNEGTAAYSYPASYNDVISVGSIDSNLKYSYFSQYNDKVDVIAPGSSIYTTGDWLNEGYGIDYVYASGTSFSAPYVSGIAALMSACKPTITAAEFSEILKATSTDLGNPGFDTHYGYGLINAEKMLQMVTVTQVESVSLNKSSTTLTVENAETLTATVYPANATNKNISWASSNTSVATVNNGIITAVGSGSATITVTTQDGGKTAFIIITAVTTVTYNGNGNTAGNVPTDGNTYVQDANVTLTRNTGNLAKDGYTFAGWNTKADATGTSYAADGSGTFTMGISNVIFYAIWTANAIAEYTATAVVQIGFNPEYRDKSGIFIGLTDILNAQGNSVQGAQLADYQLEIVYDPTQVKVFTVVNEAHLGNFILNDRTENNKISVADASNQGSNSFEKLIFVPLALTGTSNTTSVSIKFISTRETNLKNITIPDVALTFQRGKILNETNGGTLSTGDAVAGLRYLASLMNSGTEVGKINVINMASLVPLEADATGIRPSVKDIVVLMQKLVGLRDESFQLIQK